MSILVVAATSIFAAPEDISLEEGGYKGILLAVHPSVKYNPNIVPQLRVSWLCFFINFLHDITM